MPLPTTTYEPGSHTRVDGGLARRKESLLALASHRRRGSAFVLFLGSAMLLAVTALSAVAFVRIQRHTAEGVNDMTAARLCARSAIEVGFLQIRQTNNWQTGLGSGMWITNQPVQNDTISLEVMICDFDGDGNPNNDPADLLGTATMGQATYKIQVRVAPSGGGMVVSPGSWKRVLDSSQLCLS